MPSTSASCHLFVEGVEVGKGLLVSVRAFCASLDQDSPRLSLILPEDVVCTEATASCWRVAEDVKHCLGLELLLQEWIMEKWEEGYYITAVAGSDNLSSLVVMSKGTKFTQQSYKVCGPTLQGQRGR